MTTMSNLSRDLVEEILCRVPITSLRDVRSTCKRWNVLCKDPSFPKKYGGNAAKETPVITICDYRVCLMSVNLHGIHNHKDLGDPSIKQLGKLNQVEISSVFHCDGLLLCVTRDNSRLVVWNPYSEQIRWIQPINHIFTLYKYGIGYDNNNNHKILRICYRSFYIKYEIYDFKSNLWRVLDVTTDELIYRQGVPFKGNTYFTIVGKGQETIVGLKRKHLLCFDFTRERFGHRLPLPFESRHEEVVILSAVREEQLAVLRCDTHETEIWITTNIEPNAVSWRNFLKIDMILFTERRSRFMMSSFFVEEKKKVAVICYADINDKPNYKACIFKEDGYYRVVDLGKSKCQMLMCSYVPSSVQI